MWQAGARVGVIPAAPPVPGSPAFVLPLRFPGGQGAGVPQSLWRRLPCNHRPCTPPPPCSRRAMGRAPVLDGAETPRAAPAYEGWGWTGQAWQACHSGRQRPQGCAFEQRWEWGGVSLWVWASGGHIPHGGPNGGCLACPQQGAAQSWHGHHGHHGRWPLSRGTKGSGGRRGTVAARRSLGALAPGHRQPLRQQRQPRQRHSALCPVPVHALRS